MRRHAPAKAVRVGGVNARAPRRLGNARVLRYRGDVAADWRVERDAAKRSFEAAVIALAIVEDESSGGVLTLFLHANGRVADEWQESLGDALAALAETTEFDGLAWSE